jgi:hypothetical protein
MWNTHCFSLRSKGVLTENFFGRTSFFEPKAQKKRCALKKFFLCTPLPQSGKQ